MNFKILQNCETKDYREKTETENEEVLKLLKVGVFKYNDGLSKWEFGEGSLFDFCKTQNEFRFSLFANRKLSFHLLPAQNYFTPENLNFDEKAYIVFLGNQNFLPIIETFFKNHVFTSLAHLNSHLGLSTNEEVIALRDSNFFQDLLFQNEIDDYDNFSGFNDEEDEDEKKDREFQKKKEEEESLTDELMRYDFRNRHGYDYPDEDALYENYRYSIMGV
jgi:hypothetical protein